MLGCGSGSIDRDDDLIGQDLNQANSGGAPPIMAPVSQGGSAGNPADVQDPPPAQGGSRDDQGTGGQMQQDPPPPNMSVEPRDGEHPVDPNLMLSPVNGGSMGYTTRFWDCCKPHCGWPEHANSPMKICSRDDQVINNPDEGSACDGGGAHTCHNLAPWAVNENVSYGYAATPVEGDICGKCYQLDFQGGGDEGSNAIAGKKMIVQAINVGHDVQGGQFDLLIPGGGVGAFNACSSQWGVSNEELGEQYGGFLSKCFNEIGHDAENQALKECVRRQCDSVFGSRGLSDLEAGCNWFVDWLHAANNPRIAYQEVECPSELQNLSGLRR